MLTVSRKMPKISSIPIIFTLLSSAQVFGQAPYPQQPQQYPPQAPPYPQDQQYPQQAAPYPQQAPPYGQQPGQYPAQAPPYGQPRYPQQAPPYFPPQQLDQMVSRIALYPDPLLAQVMAAATYSDQIPQAAQWADQHHYLTGDALAAAISADQLPWDPSVQALLPFPNILAMMASDPSWTHQLGDAFLAQQPQVMDAVQRERRKAYDYGYLRSNGQIFVSDGPQIAIAPVNPAYIVVPYYNPAIVYYPPRPGFFVGGAIGFNFGISLGVAFRPWGWGYNRFDWGGHAIFINNARWGRTWNNRYAYVHPYAGVRRYSPAAVARPGGYARPPESHELRSRDAQERGAWQSGHAREEDHRHEQHDRQ